jgi:hypothetical protein
MHLLVATVLVINISFKMSSGYIRFAAILPNSCIVTWGGLRFGSNSASVQEQISFS